jgi:hypothetical protein
MVAIEMLFLVAVDFLIAEMPLPWKVISNQVNDK